MKSSLSRHKLSLITIALSGIFSSPVLANEDIQPSVPTQQAEAKKAKLQENPTGVIEHIQIIGHENKLRTEAGSATLIDEMELETFEYDDIHRVLANVPGVNIRQEDGYGLRPNIGFRGVTPERSKKITIMEDGVLIGPAPYSAPAAYYFPTVSRMTAVEVFKGPSAIKHGPNTVAGALNMNTRSIPADTNGQFEGQFDFAIGSDAYNKIHAYAGTSKNDIGFLVEALHSQADGFKTIDGANNSQFSEDSGFDKNDIMTKLSYQLDNNDLTHYFELKLAYADETSNETYLGLTDQDFDANPFRRYAATQVGLMDWEHQQFQLTHNVSSSTFAVTTRLYRNEFERAWRKVNGFSATTQSTARTLQDILADPTNGINQTYYEILTGQKDSESRAEQFIVGTNDREYYSQGIQSDASYRLAHNSVEQVFEAGIRFHEDRITRNHFEENYAMQSGAMTLASDAATFTSQNYEHSEAISVYLQDTIKWQALEVTAGVRGEFVDSRYQNLKSGQEQDWLEKTTRVWLPSVSAFYQLSDSAGLFAGIHEGYVPTSPKQSPEVLPEKSTNYELGGRYNNGTMKAELVGFFNDFENLKESCSFSTSASCANSARLDQEYNGGEVDVYGLEASFSNTVNLTSSYDLPWSVTYTHTQSEFKEPLDSTFELWGNITPGDEVPYLPDHQVTLMFGLAANNWQANMLVKYVGEMHEAAGDDVSLSGITTNAYTVVDLSASYDFGEYGSIYAKVDNLFDNVEIVSRRPYGARPSKPQQLYLGYKYRF
ncbi:TonB-dependent receptor family protein [Flocculibacter collagenilyticus]|uniref:TonB-dependent receptor family protein n=1 Tax=Flocculibacter collagenilyticus TaxID=2744479 RepID=UPI0018F5C3E7|nr:TonB-dependent receptor [Flocculibacter collagenilyticus]